MAGGERGIPKGIRRRESGHYEVRVRKTGFPTVCRTFDTLTEARRWKQHTEAQMDVGSFVDRRPADRLLLRDALQRYLTEITPSKKGHQERYVILAWQQDPLADRPLSKITSGDIADYVRDRLDSRRPPDLVQGDRAGSPGHASRPNARRVSAKTVRHHLALLSHVYVVAEQDWGIAGLNNPVKGRMRRLPASGTRDRRLEGDEPVRLLEACRASRNLWLAPLVELAIETAMRRGELLALLWENVDLEDGLVWLPETKNNEPRELALTSRAIHVLQSLPRTGDPRVFPITENAASIAYRAAVKRAGIEDLTFHDLRHEATSRLFEHGLDHMEVSVMTGHKTLQMLKRYTKLRARNIRKKLP